MTAPRRTGWLAPLATLTLLVAATGALTAALVLLLSDSGSGSGSSSTPGPDPHSTSGTTDADAVPALRGDMVEDGTGSVADLADPAWVASTAQATGIPERALAAYAGASIATADSHPSCGLGWNGLAAIGLVESEHGSQDRARLRPDGTVSPAVVGVPLNGEGVARIPDTDGGELDGDTAWDRAVGPMQFIPATWTELGTDGSGDGVVDIHQVDDAALTAARLLCEAGGDLSQQSGWRAALSAYNAGSAYAGQVTRAARSYADATTG